MLATQLPTAERPDFHAIYVAKVGERDLYTALDDSIAKLSSWLWEVPEDRIDYAYAPDKWTVRQALQHIIDTERIFAYRALRLGRHDSTPLPGFDQNDFMAAVDVSSRDFGAMIRELGIVRTTTQRLFESLTESDLSFLGSVSGGPMSARAMGFVICGHMYHHHEIYVERY